MSETLTYPEYKQLADLLDRYLKGIDPEDMEADVRHWLRYIVEECRVTGAMGDV